MRTLKEIFSDLTAGKLDRSQLKLRERVTLEKFDHTVDPPKLIETIERESVTPL